LARLAGKTLETGLLRCDRLLSAFSCRKKVGAASGALSMPASTIRAGDEHEAHRDRESVYADLAHAGVRRSGRVCT
jgi:hypothetical protein